MFHSSLFIKGIEAFCCAKEEEDRIKTIVEFEIRKPIKTFVKFVLLLNKQRSNNKTLARSDKSITFRYRQARGFLMTRR